MKNTKRQHTTERKNREPEWREKEKNDFFSCKTKWKKKSTKKTNEMKKKILNEIIVKEQKEKEANEVGMSNDNHPNGLVKPGYRILNFQLAVRYV